MQPKYDDVIGSASQREATTSEIDQNMLRSLGFREDMTMGTERETVDTSTLVTRFIESWRNEKCSPEILPYEHTLVSNLQDAINRSKARMEERFPLYLFPVYFS